MLLRFLLFLLLMPFSATAQLSPEVSSVVERLSGDTDFAENAISPQSQVTIDNKFRSLAGIATNGELFYVASTGDAVLKECAAAELVERKSDSLTSLFTKYLDHTNQFDVLMAGKIVTTSHAVQLFRRVAWQKEKRLRREYYERTTSGDELVEIKVLFGREFATRWSVKEADSVMNQMVSHALASDDISVRILNDILEINNYKTSDYQRIKHFSRKYQTPQILAALAAYKNPADIPFLKLHIDRAFIAISLFPDATLLPVLKSRMLNSFADPQYQDAIASFKNAEARATLETISQKLVATHHDESDRAEKMLRLYNIIEKKNCRLYEPLLERLQKY